MRLLVFAIVVLLSINVSFAQEVKNFATPNPTISYTLSIAKYLPIERDSPDDKIYIGMIVTKDENGIYRISKKAYDSNVVGVIGQKPAIAFMTAGQLQKYPVVDSGTIKIIASTKNGEIAINDSLTSSNMPGVAVKATQKGYAIGVAKEPLKGKNEIGHILALIDIHYFTPETAKNKESQKSAIDDFMDAHAFENATNEIISKITKNPFDSAKHILAGVTILLSIFLGFWTFARSSKESIRAIGRNPSASKSIGIGLLLNLIMTIFIVAAGFFLAYFMLLL